VTIWAIPGHKNHTIRERGGREVWQVTCREGGTEEIELSSAGGRGPNLLPCSLTSRAEQRRERGVLWGVR